jgi:hypothetical protein
VRTLLSDTSHRCLPFSCDQLARQSEYLDSKSAQVITQFMERMSAFSLMCNEYFVYIRSFQACRLTQSSAFRLSRLGHR